VKRLELVLLLMLASTAAAQDTSFSHLHLRVSALRNPEMGHLSEDWRARTGMEAELATNVGAGELGLRFGHIGYTPLTGKPAYSGTLFTLGWSMPVVTRSQLGVSVGPTLTDYRMDFDDPSVVGGLRTEEEVIVAGAARISGRVYRHWSVFAEASYGVLMLSTKTPMATINAGVGREMGTPEWLRKLLR
jgi:hypothetical protein